MIFPLVKLRTRHVPGDGVFNGLGPPSAKPGATLWMLPFRADEEAGATSDGISMRPRRRCQPTPRTGQQRNRQRRSRRAGNPAAAKRPSSGAKKSTSSKRTLIAPKGDKRYVRRNAKGQFKDVVDVGRSLAADRRSKSKTTAKPGQGDRGDVQR